MPLSRLVFVSASRTAHVLSSSTSRSPPAGLRLSDGEIDFLWWFIQGSIMDADVRARLDAHWGMCPRHALGFFTVEAAFRPHLIHGSAILYNELMARAVRVLAGGLYGFAPATIMRRRLQPGGPCHMCSLGYHADTPGNSPPERLAQGRDLANARSFARDNRRGWVPYICGRCAGTDNPALCRLHLIESVTHNHGQDLKVQRQAVIGISTHLGRFEHAFRWDSRDTDTDEDRGALVAAIGWCSGWQDILQTFDAD